MKKFSEQIIRGKFQKLPAFFGSFSTYFSEFEKIEEKLNWCAQRITRPVHLNSQQAYDIYKRNAINSIEKEARNVKWALIRISSSSNAL